MTRAELQALLDAAGITGARLEGTPHPQIVRVVVGGSLDDQEAARDEVEAAGGLCLLHAWIDASTKALILRVELMDGV